MNYRRKKILTFSKIQNSCLHFRRDWLLPKAAIFPLKDESCKRSNRRIQSLPCCVCFKCCHPFLLQNHNYLERMSQLKSKLKRNKPHKSLRSTVNQTTEAVNGNKQSNIVDAHYWTRRAVAAWVPERGCPLAGEGYQGQL